MTSPGEAITRAELREAIDDLFATECEIALFYFSGRGFVRNADGYIVTSDARKCDEGISMTEILAMANASPVKNEVILLDCCYSGSMGTPCIVDGRVAQLSKGLTVLTASRFFEVAIDQSPSLAWNSPATRAARLISMVPLPSRSSRNGGASASSEKTATQVAAFSHELVEAAEIEKAATLTKSGTYSRNRCLKSASWTFASAIEPGHSNPSDGSWQPEPEQKRPPSSRAEL
jgi:hypothetical protein